MAQQVYTVHFKIVKCTGLTYYPFQNNYSASLSPSLPLSHVMAIAAAVYAPLMASPSALRQPQE